MKIFTQKINLCKILRPRIHILFGSLSSERNIHTYRYSKKIIYRNKSASPINLVGTLRKVLYQIITVVLPYASIVPTFDSKKDRSQMRVVSVVSWFNAASRWRRYLLWGRHLVEKFRFSEQSKVLANRRHSLRDCPKVRANMSWGRNNRMFKA